MSETSAALRDARTRTAQNMVKTSLLVFCACLVGLTAIAWGISLFCSSVLHLGYPFNTPLYDPVYRFGDLTDYYPRVKDIQAGVIGPTLNYPAPALYVYVFFIRLFPNPVIALTTFTLGVALVALFVLRSRMNRCVGADGWLDITLLATALCSYPFVFLFDRANLEGVVWSFLFVGLVLFTRERYLLSALSFTAAVCIKPFPCLFLYLFLRRRRYKEIALALAAYVGTNLIALRSLGPSIGKAFHDVTQQGAQDYLAYQIARFVTTNHGFDHSLFSVVKVLIRLARGWPSEERAVQSDMLMAWTIWIPIGAFCILIWAAYFWRRPLLNQLFAVVLLVLLLPPVSYDYTLTSLYLPWGAFLVFLICDVGTGRIAFTLRKSLRILIPCAVLMTPQSYITLAKGGFAGQLKALVMVYLFVVIATVEMPSSLFHELPSGELRAAEDRAAEC